MIHLLWVAFQTAINVVPTFRIVFVLAEMLSIPFVMQQSRIFQLIQSVLMCMQK